MQNFQISCSICKHVNSAKHRIATASKTVTGLSSTVLQQMNVQSSEGVTNCFVLGFGALTVAGCGPNWGHV